MQDSITPTSATEVKEVLPPDILAKGIIDGQVSGAGDEIMQGFIRVFVDAKKKERTQILVNLYEQLRKLRKEAQKLQPDNIAYDDKGAKVSETYTKDRAEQLKKNREEVQKLVTAWNEAVAGKWDKAEKLVGKGEAHNEA